MIRITRTDRLLAAGLVVVLVLVAGLAVVGKHLLDQASDKADAALKQGSTLTVRVDGLEQARTDLQGALDSVKVITAGLQAGLTLNAATLASAFDGLSSALASLPAGITDAADRAGAQLLAAVDAAKGLTADLGRALQPVGSLADQLGHPVRVDIHIVRPLVDDLLNLLPRILAGLT